MKLRLKWERTLTERATDLFVIMVIALFLLATMTIMARSQAWTPPNCYGTVVLNGQTCQRFLQYGPPPAGGSATWLCNAVCPGTASLPADTTNCISSKWNGTAWVCVQTNLLTAN